MATQDSAPTVRSYKPEVYAEGSWSDNALRFATLAEAERWARMLLMRWFVPTDSRGTASTDPVNSRLETDGSVTSIADERSEVAA